MYGLAGNFIDDLFLSINLYLLPGMGITSNILSNGCNGHIPGIDDIRLKFCTVGQVLFRKNKIPFV